TQEDQDELWAGLKDGTIDFIATDHAPHTLEEKSQPYPHSPSGMPGVETSLPLILTAWKSGRCTLAEVLKWMCWGPVEAYGIMDRGNLSEGCHADLAIVNVDDYRPVRDAEMFTKVRWNPFSGRELTGWPVWTIVNGQIAFTDGKICENVRGEALRFSSE
ncbi:MAG: amidohydrolase family protein, partial [Gammaproteobacteria bacterium]|nr:amidohydrolase family protein [Gammaproteobacteria bacterium]